MRRLLGLTVVPLVWASVALSAPAITTSDVNLRMGPGTQFQSIAVLPAGTEIEILECSVASIWCEIFAGDEAGFVSGNFIAEATAAAAPPGETVVGPGDPFSFDDGDLFTDEELDSLVAPIALFPDDLLTQILVAATEPLEVILADRWVAANGDLAPEERAGAAAAGGWDESVTILAAGFPAVIEEMAREIEWTRSLGDAVIAQSEDVLDAVQSQRARAHALGNLETNEAQRVEVTNNVIVIEPAQPDVVFVPRYDPVRVFTQPAPAPVIVRRQGSVDTGAAIATGAVAFVTGYTLGRVFDDRWRRSYWWGPRRVNWTVNNFYPRPGWRPGVRPDRPWRPGERPQRPGDRPGAGQRPDRPGAGRPDRPETGRPDRPGSRPDREAERPWRPDDRQREEARRRIRDERASRERPGAPGATRPRDDTATRPNAPGQRPADRRPDRASLEQRLQARGSDARAPSRPGAGAQNRPGASRPGEERPAADQSRQGARDARQAANRGRESAAPARPPRQQQRASRPAAGTASRPQQRQAPPQRAAANRQPQRQAQRPAQQPAQQRPAQRQAQPRPAPRQAQPRPNRSAMERGSGGARQAAASRSRGSASRGSNRRNRQ